MYPKNLYVGCEVIVAISPDVPKSQWRLGRIMQLKNMSCDIQVATQFGLEYRHDVIHIDDPRCMNSKVWADPAVGVFDLAPSEQFRAEAMNGFHAMRKEIAELKEQFKILQKFVEGRSPKA
jgi:hypothetical protein